MSNNNPEAAGLGGKRQKKDRRCSNRYTHKWASHSSQRDTQCLNSTWRFFLKSFLTDFLSFFLFFFLRSGKFKQWKQINNAKQMLFLEKNCILLPYES